MADLIGPGISIAFMVWMGCLSAWTRYDRRRARRVLPLMFASIHVMAAAHLALGLIWLGLLHPWRAAYGFALAALAEGFLRLLLWLQRKFDQVLPPDLEHEEIP